MSIDLSKIIRARQKIKAARKSLSDAFEGEDARLKEKQKELETFLLGYLIDNNAKSLATDEGTVFRKKDTIPRADDWDTIYNWIAETNAFDALERRIKKTFVSTYMEANNGSVPPGMSVFSEWKVGVRRSNAQPGEDIDE